MPMCKLHIVFNYKIIVAAFSSHPRDLLQKPLGSQHQSPLLAAQLAPSTGTHPPGLSIPLGVSMLHP